MTDNIATFPTPQERVARALRDDIRLMTETSQREKDSADAWRANAINTCLHFAEARDMEPTDDRAFGAWCEANGVTLNSDDRAAAIAMGRDPERLKAVLATTARRSLQMIYRHEFVSRSATKDPAPKRAALPPSPVTDRVRDEAVVLLLAGVPRTEIRAKLGVSDTVLRVLHAEVKAGVYDEPDTSTFTAKQRQTFEHKLKVAQQRVEARLVAEYSQRMANLSEEVRLKVVAEGAEYLAYMKAREAEAEAVKQRYLRLTDDTKPILTREQFMLLHLCVRDQASEEKRHQAGVLLNEKRDLLTHAGDA